MSSHNKEEAKKELPEYISDPNSGKNYIRGKFLGKVSVVFAFSIGLCLTEPI